MGGAFFGRDNELVVLSYSNFTHNEAELGYIYILGAAEIQLDCLKSGYTMTGFPAYHEVAAVEMDGFISYFDNSFVISMDEFYCE